MDAVQYSGPERIDAWLRLGSRLFTSLTAALELSQSSFATNLVRDHDTPCL